VKNSLFILLLLLFVPAAFAQLPNSGLSEPQQIEKILVSTWVQATREPIALQNSVRQIYQLNEYEPFWTSDHKIQQMVAVLENSIEYGLQPADYHLSAITELVTSKHLSPTPAVMAELDLLLSDGLLLYVHHRRDGKVHPGALYPEFNFERDHSDDLSPVELVQQAMATDNLADFIDAQAPTADYYELLRQQLKLYRKIAANGAWPMVPAGPTLRKNDRDARVMAMRKRLQVTGELQSPANPAGDLFDEELEQAVMLFQSLHGLATDGLVGKQTLVAMNVAAESRVDQLRLSLERLRWLEHNTDREFIAINIAGFELAYVKDQKIEWTTRVIVGTPYRSTPVFRSLMTYLEFNPTWTIPPTILREDTIPAIRKNPDYLADRDISVIDFSGQNIDPLTIDWNTIGKGISFSLRQEPGPQNALGQVKFIFPNPYFVFMHDTPQRALFERSIRSYSSGCIRVEKPFSLVELVLQDRQDFPQDKLDEILSSGRTQRVLLERPMPVLILYLTAALDSSGRAQFYPDIYDRDPAILGLLNGPVISDSL
jgi:murein L,D-transpeptidase YcbB/YkuD